jgi:hypothetical protein
MLFGVPVGSHQMHVDADVSDIGILSQFPYDLIREGANENLFESNAKFIGKTNKENLLFSVDGKQIKVTPRGRIL